MCNREISSRRIDCFFREALWPSAADRQGGRTNPADRWRYEKCRDRSRVKVIFRVLDENPTHKHVLRRQMTEIGNLTSWPQMTLTLEKVTSG